MPWADWLHLAWVHLGTTPLPPDNSLKAWRSLRRRVLTVLAELGAEAFVIRTDDDVPLDEHLADLAGLVRVAVPGVWPALRPAGNDPTDAWLRDELGLTPALFPATLRGLCGQVSASDDERDPLSRTSLLLNEPSWDHPRAWLDPISRPVLSIRSHTAPAERLDAFGRRLPLTLAVYSTASYDPVAEHCVLFQGDAELAPPLASWSPEPPAEQTLRELATRFSLPELVEPFGSADLE